MKIHVAFFDNSKAVIIASFGCEQDLEVWPYQDAIAEDDERWVAYSANLPFDQFAQSVTG